MILYNYSDSLTTIFSKDLAVLTEKKEYLRRFYSGKPVSSTSEAQEKMRQILSNYTLSIEAYQKGDKTKITFEYPTMFITSTYKIFLNRLICLQKKKAYDISS